VKPKAARPSQSPAKPNAALETVAAYRRPALVRLNSALADYWAGIAWSISLSKYALQCIVTPEDEEIIVPGR
jgi:hypothetical protein